MLFVKLPNGQYNVVARTGSIVTSCGHPRLPGMPSATIERMNDDIADAAAADAMRGTER